MVNKEKVFKETELAKLFQGEWDNLRKDAEYYCGKGTTEAKSALSNLRGKETYLMHIANEIGILHLLKISDPRIS